MPDLPTEWGALAALALLFGLKHGFDADHLATIDALTRVNARHGERHARWCGALFALGHGAAVVLMVAALAAAGARWPVPEWLGPLGGGISIALLTALGIANLRAVFAAAPGEVVVPRGLKGRLFARLFGRARRPLAVALVGSLFAVSFDTVSQAGLFALGGTASGGLGHALALGALFALGMLCTDAFNGLWVARLISGAGQMTAAASRATSLAVALVSLLVAGLGVGKWASASVDDWAEGKKMVFGAAVIAIVAARGLLAHWLARRDGAAARLSACASSSAPAPGS
jgi:high-affinity nickel-transport protein